MWPYFTVPLEDHKRQVWLPYDHGGPLKIKKIKYVTVLQTNLFQVESLDPFYSFYIKYKYSILRVAQEVWFHIG
jgi:hypothetical protein